MNGFFFVLLVMYAISYALAIDEECPRYHYEQQILSKQIRMDLRLDLLEEKIEKLEQQEVKTACADEWMSYKSSCYLFGRRNLDFAEAKVYCERFGSHLVSIQNSNENEFIKRQIAELSAKKFWIGMSDQELEGDWRWIDSGKKVHFFDWGSEQPNNGRISNCAAIWASFGNKFVDEPCTNRQFRPICKRLSQQF